VAHSERRRPTHRQREREEGLKGPGGH
jgi:hypothetical protein